MRNALQSSGFIRQIEEVKEGRGRHGAKGKRGSGRTERRRGSRQCLIDGLQTRPAVLQSRTTSALDTCQTLQPWRTLCARVCGGGGVGWVGGGGVLLLQSDDIGTQYQRYTKRCRLLVYFACVAYVLYFKILPKLALTFCVLISCLKISLDAVN